jgi:hypothetical protein
MSEAHSATRIRAWSCECELRCRNKSCACARQSGSNVCLCACVANDLDAMTDNVAPESNPRRRLSVTELVDLRVSGLTHAELAVFLTRVTGVELSVPTNLLTETTNKTFAEITMSDLIDAFGFTRID